MHVFVNCAARDEKEGGGALCNRVMAYPVAPHAPSLRREPEGVLDCIFVAGRLVAVFRRSRRLEAGGWRSGDLEKRTTIRNSSPLKNATCSVQSSKILIYSM